MSSPLTLTAILNSPMIPVTGTARMVYLLVEIGGGKDAKTMPMNLGLVIDTSESMRIRLVTEKQFQELIGSGNSTEVLKDGIPAWEIESIPANIVNTFPRKIDYVSDALHAVSEYLRPSDFFSLTAFASRAELLLPMTPGRERHKLPQKAGRLGNLQLGDETCMAAGISLSYADICEKQQKKAANRMILLTDGYTQDVKECYEWAQKARENGLAITTMGLGVEFNEDLLIPIAEMTGGNAYYIEKPGQVPDAFRKELGAALGIVYRSLKLNLQNSPGVELRRVHRVLPELGNIEIESSQNGRTTCFIGHYDPGSPPAALLEFVIPPWVAGAYRMTNLRLSWEEGEGETQRSSFATDIAVHMQHSPSGAQNSRVMEVVNKVGAFKFGNFALEHAEEEDQTDAVKQLNQAASRLEEVGEPALAAEMTRLAEQFQRRGKLDSNATKKLRYETRMISRRL